jgi:hypothetical protein
MKLVVGMNSGLGLIRCHSNDCAFARVEAHLPSRNLKDCTRTVKETSYTAIVRPTIEYAATVWDPTSQSKIKALENIQRRAVATG